jgi:RNA polymerase sigma-70 factor (ECF subfamily)
MPKQPLRAGAETPDPARWVDRHGDYLFRYALARLRRPDLAEDVVQEALLGALQGRRRFAGLAAERTWLVGILKHKIMDHLRRRYRERPLSDLGPDAWLDELFDRSGHWKKGVSRWEDPSAACEDAEFWDAFARCLNKLPPRLADAFCLRALDDLPGAQVCKVLGVSPSNLGVMLHRARLGLCRCLDTNWFAGGGGR